MDSLFFLVKKRLHMKDQSVLWRESPSLQSIMLTSATVMAQLEAKAAREEAALLESKRKRLELEESRKQMRSSTSKNKNVMPN